ncbi:aldehyde dehydrogenase family protein [Mycobacterium sp. smrl_JER01]|uniref:aldehyde dehydrogenase family protein n=1 Tax=Mycobacterium sp. smrl_JER01 TaxID=3402633 RepID=UPI003ACC3666
MSTVNTIINPATEEAIDEFDVADVDAAVQRSAVAQRKWVNLLLSARGEALRATADTVAANLRTLRTWNL